MTVCMIMITFTLGRFPDNTNDQLWSLQTSQTTYRLSSGEGTPPPHTLQLLVDFVPETPSGLSLNHTGDF